MEPELEIILPVHPSVYDFWALMGWSMLGTVAFMAVLVILFWWKSEPISYKEVQRVLRSKEFS